MRVRILGRWLRGPAEAGSPARHSCPTERVAMIKLWIICLAAAILAVAAAPLVTADEANDFVTEVQTQTRLPFEVQIEIKPEEDPNWLNPESEGLIAVVIYSTSAFDAYAEVNEESVRFGRRGSEAGVDRCSKNAEDFDGDGILDLVCFFEVAEAGFETHRQILQQLRGVLGPNWRRNRVDTLAIREAIAPRYGTATTGDAEAVLIGQTLAGVPFEGEGVVRVSGDQVGP